MVYIHVKMSIDLYSYAEQLPFKYSIYSLICRFCEGIHYLVDRDICSKDKNWLLNSHLFGSSHSFNVWKNCQIIRLLFLTKLFFFLYLLGWNLHTQEDHSSSTSSTGKNSRERTPRGVPPPHTRLNGFDRFVNFTRKNMN